MVLQKYNVAHFYNFVNFWKRYIGLVLSMNNPWFLSDFYLLRLILCFRERSTNSPSIYGIVFYVKKVTDFLLIHRRNGFTNKRL